MMKNIKEFCYLDRFLFLLKEISRCILIFTISGLTIGILININKEIKGTILSYMQILGVSFISSLIIWFFCIIMIRIRIGKARKFCDLVIVKEEKHA